MSSSPLQGKTIRPNSLTGYSYYYSRRRPVRSSPSGHSGTTAKKLSRGVSRRHNKLFSRGLLTVLALAAIIFGPLLSGHWITSPAASSANPNQTVSNPAAIPYADSTNHCAGNQLPQLVLVSIKQQHLWACAGNKQIFDSSVVTGISYLAADITPTGTYHIYAKETNTHLTGQDTTGKWDDFVHYWMPFLQNQYGAYGLHDATWRSANSFGKINPDSAKASHGCVELPLSTARWLYDWTHVGTTVTIEN